MGDLIELADMAIDDFAKYQQRGLKMTADLKLYTKASRKVICELFRNFEEEDDEVLKNRPREVLKTVQLNGRIA